MDEARAAVALDLSGRPFCAWGGLTLPPGDIAGFEHEAGGGVLPRRRLGARADAARRPPGGHQRPPHDRGVLQGVRPRAARRGERRSRGDRRPVDQGRALVIAVVDYGMGNRRRVEKALAHVGAEAVITRDHELLARGGEDRRPRAWARSRARWSSLEALGLADAAAGARARPASRCWASASACSCCSRPRRSTAAPAASACSRARSPTWTRRASGCRTSAGTSWDDAGARSRLAAATPPSTTCIPWPARPADPGDVVGTATYGETFASIVERGNVFGAQFHPEKSSRDGLALLRNFVTACVILYPAIDIQDGRAVRLVQGRFEDETVYRDDPAGGRPRLGARPGATHLHVVDLDGARHGRAAVARPPGARSPQLGVPVQYGGGLRSIDAVARRRRRRRAARDPRHRGLQGPRLPRRRGRGVRPARRSSPSTSAAATSPPPAGRRRPSCPPPPRSSRCRTAACGRSSTPTPTATACSRGPTSTTSARSPTPSAAAGSTPAASAPPTTSARLRDLRLLNLTGVISGKALYEGAFTVAEGTAALTALSCTTSASSPAWTSMRGGSSRARGSSTSATPETPSSWPPTTTSTAPTRSSSSTSRRRRTSATTVVELARRAADEVFVPFTIGGGVRTVADAQAVLDAGADKVSVNSAAVARPELLTEMAQQFGDQCVVLAIDARRRGRRDLRGGRRRRPHADGPRRHRVGPGGRRARGGGDPADLDGPRRRPRTATTSIWCARSRKPSTSP